MRLNSLENGKNMIEPCNSLACLLHVSKHVSTSYHAHLKHIFKHINHSQHILNMFQSLKTFLEMF